MRAVFEGGEAEGRKETVGGLKQFAAMEAYAMRQSTRVRRTAMVAAVGAAAALAPIWSMRADERAPDQGALPDVVGRMQSFPMEEGGVPPRAMRLRVVVARAWDDSVATWKRLMGKDAAEIDQVRLRYVSQLKPDNCYGLYAGEGPAYCSGNNTVFVGTGAAHRLMARFGAQGEAGITFLIGHEMGHHIQNIQGRFLLLNHVLAHEPARRLDLLRRFELEADCYAGVWIHSSEAWASSDRFRAQLYEVLLSIGDENMREDEPDSRTVRMGGVHGTSQQRIAWFTRGVESGDWHVCKSFSAARP